MSDLIFDFLAPPPFLHGNEIFNNICRNANWEEMRGRYDMNHGRVVKTELTQI